MTFDMDYYEDRIYILRGGEIIVLDTYGNTLESIAITDKSNRIVVDRDIFLFTPFSNRVLKKGAVWQQIELKQTFIDLSVSGNNVWVLSRYGDTIFVYDRSDF